MPTLSKRSFREVWRRSLMSLIGVLIFALGATILLAADLGMDPYSAMNLGVSQLLGWQLGPYQLLLNLLILGLVFLIDRHLIGVGTIFNMALVGYGIQFFSLILLKNLPTPSSLLMQVLVALLGLLVFTFGLAMYIVADVGISPYDAITPMILKVTHSKNYRFIRILQDVTAMVIAILVHGHFGLVTIIVAFGSGPFIIFWERHVLEKLLKIIKAA
ncbi:YczE/YyaS/YitT family protein [Lapidilactobacillus dextrinicus]|uniref:YczE/YyaS/YitT family protein n=1 Tax=Lapidilactobacillus dextrinicus TaxID=51664 RepID=UPI003F2946A0